MSETGDAPRGHWIEGRWIAEAEARSGWTRPGWTGLGWSWPLGVGALIVLLDLVLALVPAPASTASMTTTRSRAELREVIEAAAAGPGRSLLVLGDRELGASELRAHVDLDAQVELQAIDLAELRPSDALALTVELDRLDPRARVELALTIDLRDFGAALAESSCAQVELCALADEEPGATLTVILDWLRVHTPVLRHRARLRLDSATQSPSTRAPALVSRLPGLEHAQVRALDSLLTRLHASHRRATLILPPLQGVVDEAARGRLQADLAGMINDLDDPAITLVDLDHPLFLTEHFDAEGKLGREGRELLATNLVFELGLPLDRRPFEWQMVHPEGHDRTLVHRVDPGFAEAGAATTRFAAPQGVATSRDGRRIVIADTGNHMLRQLRGNQQTVERLAGDPDQADVVDGPARTVARLFAPRRPELDGDRVLFIDGEQGELLRMVDDDQVSTLTWTGPQCRTIESLRVRPSAGANTILLLCGNGRLLGVDLDEGVSVQLVRASRIRTVAFDADAERVWLADADAKIWERRFEADGALTSPRLLFANRAREPEGDASDLLPHGHRVGFPYHFDDIALAKVVDMRWVDRYDSLLVMDEHPVAADVDPVPSERVHLRLLDFEVEQVFPWIKPQAHGEANTLWNQSAQLNASWYHVGSMALVEDDASLVWLEHDRSRLIRIADGLLGVAQTANHHTNGVTIPHLTTLWTDSARRANVIRPDRFLDRRAEPLVRQGPYVMLVIGSSLSSMSDRFGNYSLARRIERELQRELGYRDRIRVDVFAASLPAAGFEAELRQLESWLESSAPPDVVLLEAHDFAGNWLRELPEPKQVAELFVKLEALASRYDTLVIFYDNSQMEANRRDGLRSTDANVIAVLDQARALGFTVVRPGDLLLERLATDSPWGNQPFANNQHHGSTWAVDRSAELIAALAYPVLREFLRGRTPARLHERDPAWFEGQAERGEPLRSVVVDPNIDRKKLPKVATSYLQRDYSPGRLRIHVDLAGYPKLVRSEAQLERLAIAVALTLLEDDIHADLARELDIEIVEFANYDEYGDGVIDSAKSLWKRHFDREGLQAFLRQRAPKSRKP